MSTKVRFVIIGSEEQELMRKAAQAVQTARLPTEKITVSDVLKLEKDKHLYVCSQFSGQAFEHLVKVKCRVVGPQCVITCLELQIAVPNVPHPVNNLAMQDVVVSCSSIEKAKRESIHKLLEWMGGRVSRDFTEMVTHLVVGEVGSKKYHVAANLKKPIMLPEWIEAAWLESQDKQFSATTDSFLREHKCPSFKGCIVCVTGVESTQRSDVRQKVAEYGGYYSGELKYNECTHLIVGSPSGPKYEFARKWKIHTVSVNWFYDSIEAGYCLDEQLYCVLSQEQPTSTPVKDKKGHPRLSTLGNISAINASSIHPVDETAVNEPSITAEVDRLSHQPPAPPIATPTGLDQLDRLDITICPADMFLDGCKIFLSGFAGQHLEKLRKLVNTGGATRFNQLSENVSHIVIGQHIKEDIGVLKTLQHRPMIVSVQWLLECFRQGRQVPETDFELHDVVEDADKENEVTFKLPTNQQVKKTNRASVRKTSDESAHDEEDILSQYLPNASTTGGNDSTMIQEENQSRRRSEGAGSKSQEGDNADDDDDETQIDEEEEEEEEEEGGGAEEGIFAGKRFVVLGFTLEQEKQICEMIPEHAGTVLPINTRAIPDYAVVPIMGWAVNMTVGEIMTNCWLQMCLETGSLLEPASNVLFTPIPILQDVLPLQGCVISISQYCYVERDCLLHIAGLLGAHCQEYFVRKAVNNLEANTHLLLREPEGTKYVAAKKWKVPAVTKEWLLACARTGKKQAEKDYLIDLPAAQASGTTSKEVTTDTKEVIGQALRDQAVENVTGNKSNLESSSVNVSAGDHPPPQEDKEKAIEITEQVTPTGSAGPAAPRAGDLVKQVLLKQSSVEVKGYTPGRDGTPSRLLRPGFKPSFDLEEAVAALDSPGGASGMKGNRRKSSLPLDEFFHQNIANALQIRLGGGAAGDEVGEDAEDNVFQEEPAPGVLHGVVICVSKKLSRKQGDYNAIATAMGAEYYWAYDEKCTHFIFQGKANDTAKEFRLARSQGKVIVSPHWLLACQEENKRFDEANYPHTYNPKLSLSVVGSRSQTPARSVRSRVEPVAVLASPLAPPPVALAPPPPPAPAPAPAPPKPAETTADGFDADTMSDDELLRAVDAGEQRKTPVEEGSYLKQDLQKQLEDIMPSTMNLRGGRRRSRRPGSSASGLTGGGDMSGAESTGSGRRSTRLRSKRSAEKTEGAESGKDIGIGEASQSVQITWDDPTSRREKEKVMAQLKRTDNGQNEPQQRMDVDPQAQEAEAAKDQASTSSKPTPKGAPKPEPEDTPPTPTPKAPPIRFPAAKPAVAPLPTDEAQDDPQEIPSRQQPAAAPKFLFTGMSQQEKIDYGALIEQLGGEVKDAQYFDASCSHIIVGNPTRNEKYLAALATGKWVLHKSYLEACRERQGFIEEEPHEWGNNTDLSKLNETGKKMALAASRWRMRIQEQGKEGSSTGAFDGWRVLLLVEKNKEMCFKRLLEAGGARVLAVRPPFAAHLDASHAFFDLHKVKVDTEQVSLEALVQNGVLCLKPEYIADFLVHDPSPEPQNYIITEAKPILQALVEEAGQAGSSSKRRGSELPTTPRSKRSRHR